jgi:hypothetical protein
MHGFDRAADAEVDLSARAGPLRCKLVLVDAGRAFDPTARPFDGIYA